MDTCITKRKQTRERITRNRDKAARQIENLFFEVSRTVQSPEMLASWVAWFRRLHIPCAIAKTEGGYTLWRKGKEAGGKRSKAPSVPMTIVCSFGLTARELNLMIVKQQEKPSV
jgi:hypothetical protein